VPSLIEHGRVIRPWHGVFGKLVTVQFRMLLKVPLMPGFMVETVEPGSPAETLGLRGGYLPVSVGADEYLLGGDITHELTGYR